MGKSRDADVRRTNSATGIARVIDGNSGQSNDAPGTAPTEVEVVAATTETSATLQPEANNNPAHAGSVKPSPSAATVPPGVSDGGVGIEVGSGSSPSSVASRRQPGSAGTRSSFTHAAVGGERTGGGVRVAFKATSDAKLIRASVAREDEQGGQRRWGQWGEGGGALDEGSAEASRGGRDDRNRVDEAAGTSTSTTLPSCVSIGALYAMLTRAGVPWECYCAYADLKRRYARRSCLRG